MSWEIRLIRVAVGILKRDDRVLVAERPKDKSYSGYWEFPGGKFEPNESGEQALKRELHEELGIDVLVATLWCECIHTYPDRSVVLEIWIVDQFACEPQGREGQLLRWVTFPEMQKLRLLEGNLAIMDRLKSLYSCI